MRLLRRLPTTGLYPIRAMQLVAALLCFAILSVIRLDFVVISERHP
jgi:hypothetical protein